MFFLNQLDTFQAYNFQFETIVIHELIMPSGFLIEFCAAIFNKSFLVKSFRLPLIA